MEMDTVLANLLRVCVLGFCAWILSPLTRL